MENYIAQIKVKGLSGSAIMPSRGSEYAAGWDLYSAENADINPGETVKVKTDIAIQIPNGYFGGLYARSGLATKKGLRPANCVGIIDSDYRGNIIVPLHNDSDEKRTVPKGERIAQLIIQPYLVSELIHSFDLDDTERGEGGFGSTGTM